MKWFIKCFKQYVDFNSRARRKEYWFFALFNFIISLVLMCLWIGPVFVEAVSAELNGTEMDEGNIVQKLLYNPALYIWILYYLATIIPSIAVTVRRLHDIGKSGLWAILFCGAPFLSTFANTPNQDVAANSVIALIEVGVCIFGLIWMFTDSQPGENQWGPNPKENPTPEEMTPNDLI